MINKSLNKTIIFPKRKNYLNTFSTLEYGVREGALRKKYMLFQKIYTFSKNIHTFSKNIYIF